MDIYPSSGEFQDPGTGEVDWSELGRTALDRIISSQHDFCKFMQKLFVPDDHFHAPPEGGLAIITQERFAPLGKSDLVINVLKNFIYIEGQYEGYPHNILPETQSADYRDPYLHADIRDQPDLVRFSTEGPDVSVSGDVIGLTFGGVGCEDFCSIADMTTIFSRHAKHGPPGGEGGSEWRGELAWLVEDFFDFIKDEFITMEQLPRDECLVIDEVYDVREILNQLREIYTSYGWPDVDFKKEECVFAVETFITSLHQ